MEMNISAKQVGVKFLSLVAFGALSLTWGASSAQAQNISQRASTLQDMDPQSSNYGDLYGDAANMYSSMASDYSLEFDDWFAMNSLINHSGVAYGSDGAKLQSLIAMDGDDLTWEAGASDVELFFINEGAGYYNKFGYSTATPTGDLGNHWDTEVTTIWNAVASNQSMLANGGSMSLGEGYRIGDVAAGEKLNFFLKNPLGHVLDSEAADSTMNGDGLQHVTTYRYKDFLVLGYEDIYGGGDKDYEDVVIAVRGLADTEVYATQDVPEPASLLGLVAIAGAAAWKRKQSLTSS